VVDVTVTTDDGHDSGRIPAAQVLNAGRVGIGVERAADALLPS
jgi:hypothetical protein